MKFEKKNHFKNYAHSKKVLEALQHITSLMILEKQRVPWTLTKTYSHGRFTQTTLTLKLILLTEKILRITQRDFTNIYTLHIEIQKRANGLSPSLMKKLFKVNSTVLYSLKKQIELYSENSKIIMYRSDTITLNRSKYIVNSPKTKRKAEIIAFISEIDKISKPDSDFYPKFIYNMLVSSEKANMIFNNLIYK